MIRILHVVTYMGRGGLETMLMNYYRAMDKTQIQFDFLTHRDFKADYDDEIEKMGGIIYHLPRLNPMSSLYKRKLGLFFDEHPEYKIIHVHQDCLSGVVLKVAKEHGVLNRIAHSHSSSQTKDIKYPVKLFLKRNIAKNATALYACSKMAGEWMFCGAKFSVLNNAIDTQRYQYNIEVRKKMRQELGIDNSEFVIGHVGRFCTPKNHKFIIEIFGDLCKECNAKLILVGDGELREEIIKKVKELGIEKNVIFTGVRDDVADILQTMDVFLFPSLYEGLPVTIIEAQAAGLPCLISDKVPIECKITDLVYGLSLNDSTRDWIGKILELKTIKRCNMSKEVIEAEYDIKKNADKLKDYYFSLL